MSWPRLKQLAACEAVPPQALADAIDVCAEELDLFYPDTVVDEWTGVLDYLGFTDIRISWSGFCSQGDGASFTGKLSWPESLIRFLAGLPYEDPVKQQPDAEAAAVLEWAQRDLSWKPDPSMARALHSHELCSGVVIRIGHHYSHSHTVSWEWDHYVCGDPSKLWLDDFKAQAKALVVSIGNTIYRALEQESEWARSETAIVEHLEANYGLWERKLIVLGNRSRRTGSLIRFFRED